MELEWVISVATLWQGKVQQQEQFMKKGKQTQ
jgi:hypothetical protein